MGVVAIAGRARMAALALAAASAAAALSAIPAAAREIAADLSSHRIEITAGFDGAELLLYGHDEHRADVMVIVRGPEQSVEVRKKERVAGIWVNRQEVRFEDAPVFYFVGVTDGLRAGGTLDSVLQETGLGARFLNPKVSSDTANPRLAAEFRDALVELRSRRQLYAAEPGRIAMRPDGLFRVTIPFPAATPVGVYKVTVYHVVDGWPIAGAITPLEVHKAGFGAFVYKVAHEEPFLYGLIAILVAIGAGWLGGQAFRRS
ncbi:MAG: TIGR02186 family protein [Alphaproteobacteria bacterium]